ncbi:MAG TPA: nucleotide exchange factor GrpE [Syntrophales bacterium]|jgi:molecular chaperone GrpE|nr:nucleotide exchange factor GrpE [Syntrophales bacterium]HPX55976.1 nucleotide exchange factor GrpE [Syntrophales bacterium]
MTKKVKKDSVQDHVEISADAEEALKAESPETGSAETAAGDLQTLIREKEKTAKDNYDKYLRALADLENYKKRAAREKQDTIKYGNENLIKDLLPLIDGMDRALECAEKSDDFESFREGLKMLQDQLCCCLQRHGVETIDASGQVFDPNIHEALMLVESPEHEANQVVTQLEKGYILNGRLIRPAKVCVCKK